MKALKHKLAALGAAQTLAALTVSTASLAAGQATEGPAVKIEAAVVNIPARGTSSSMTLTEWDAAAGQRIELSDSGAQGTLLMREGKGGYILDAATRQALAFFSTSAPLRRYYLQHDPRVGPLQHQKLLAPVDFLGYQCAVREGVQMVNGVLQHVQVWDAKINGKRETLRQYSQGEDGSVDLFEAIRVQTYRVAPPGLLEVPAGYTVTAMTAPSSSNPTRKPE